MKTSVPSRSSAAAVGVLCAVMAATLFSTAGVIVRHIELPAWDISFWRSALLVVTMLPLLMWQRRGVLIDVRNAGLALVASAVLLAGAFVSFILALGLAPVANVLGLSLSVAGSLQAGALAGMAVAFIVVLCMSGNYVVVRYRRDVGMAPAIWLAGVISGLLALPFAHPETVTWAKLPWLLALSPGQLVGGLLLYMASLKRIPAGRAALLGLLELVLGPVWVWLFDGEKPDDLTLMGGVIVIGAAAANVWLDSRRTAG